MRRYFNILQENTLSDNNFKTIQNAREDVIGELDAVIQYSNHLRETNCIGAQITIKSIMEEEEVHIGELMGLLFRLDEGFKARFDQGIKEFNENLEKANQ